ncbi:MAG: FUSC family membrane protein [Ginsengibacter sp.]
MEKSQQIRFFLFGQNLADGIRITLEIILPVLIFSYFGHLETGYVISIGALCVSISDGPGPVVHKRNGMLYTSIFIFIMSILTGYLNVNPISLGLLILGSTFFFSMFSVYGNRAGSIGTAALLVMILRMARDVPPSEVLTQSLLVLAGGLWYMLIALFFYRLTPYRPAQRALGDCINETADFLLIKSKLYDTQSNLREEYRKLLDKQVLVNEKQDIVRELLFKNRTLLKESTHYGRVLVLTFTYVVDLFENIMATWYDYSSLRKRFGPTGILEDIRDTLVKIAGELKNIADAIHSNSSYKKEFNIIQALEELKIKIDNLQDRGSTFMLKKILVNLRDLGAQVDEILKYFEEDLSGKRQMRTQKDYSRFVTHQQINGTILKNNLTMESSIFRHSLRVMITCGVGYIISLFIFTGQHSYWILMTIIIILKPGFTLTKERNFDRLTGTIGGGIIGLLIIGFIKDQNILFAFIVFFMVGTYTFIRLNYIVMVIFLTPYVLILFHFLGLGAVDVASERLIDTAIASLLAFLANYYLFPHWESRTIQANMAGVLKANLHYLRKLRDLLNGVKISSIEYKLVRKELFVATANLSGALHRMLSEPKSKQLHRKEIYEFVVLNHVLSSNIASLTASFFETPQIVSKEILHRIKRITEILEDSLQKIDMNELPDNNHILTENPTVVLETDENLKEQLFFIQKVSEDIKKLSLKISS